MAVSLLDMDYANFKDSLAIIRSAGLDMAHLDVMDGQFVPNLGIGPKMIESLRKVTDLFFDVHLMVKDPERFIEKMAKAGADRITVHQEACQDPARAMDLIRQAGVQAGICLRPETPLTVLDRHLLEKTDAVLLMTTVPGVEGVSFIPSSVEKIAALRARIDLEGFPVRIETDGGINDNNLPMVIGAGADEIVVGRSLVLGNMAENIKRLQAVMEGAA